MNAYEYAPHTVLNIWNNFNQILCIFDLQSRKKQWEYNTPKCGGGMGWHLKIMQKQTNIKVKEIVFKVALMNGDTQYSLFNFNP